MKKLQPALEIIRKINQKTDVTTDRASFENAVLTRNKNKRFVLEAFETDLQNRLTIGDEVQIHVSQEDLSFDITGYVWQKNVSVGDGYSQKCVIEVQSFQHLTDLAEEYFCRKFIPLEKALNWYNIFDKLVLNINVDKKDLQIYQVTEEQNRFLVIDCLNKMLPTHFSDVAWSVLVTLGYLIGSLPQGEEYSFYYESIQMEEIAAHGYCTLRKSLESIYYPVCANPHSWIKGDAATKYRKLLTHITEQHFSKLCQIVHDEKEIKGILLLITESIKGSLLLMPAGLSIALEGLAEYFYQKNKASFKPIRNRDIAKAIVSRFKDVLNDYTGNTDVSLTILERKINDLNKPTNRDRLKAPFVHFKIELSEIDQDVLEFRNKYLHGNITLTPKKGEKPYTLDSFEISLRLLTLLNCVIISMSGYSGYILNHVKIQENGLGKVIEEEPYRIIVGIQANESDDKRS